MQKAKASSCVLHKLFSRTINTNIFNIVHFRWKRSLYGIVWDVFFLFFFMYDKHKKLRSNSWKKIEILSILFGGKLERLSGENMRIVRENNKNNIYSFCGNCSAHIQMHTHIYLSIYAKMITFNCYYFIQRSTNHKLHSFE